MPINNDPMTMRTAVGPESLTHGVIVRASTEHRPRLVPPLILSGAELDEVEPEKAVAAQPESS